MLSEKGKWEQQKIRREEQLRQLKLEGEIEAAKLFEQYQSWRIQELKVMSGMMK